MSSEFDIDVTATTEKIANINFGNGIKRVDVICVDLAPIINKLKVIMLCAENRVLTTDQRELMRLLALKVVSLRNEIQTLEVKMAPVFSISKDTRDIFESVVSFSRSANQLTFQKMGLN